MGDLLIGRLRALRPLSATVAIAVITAACGGGSTNSSGLAGSQVFKFPTYQSPGTWDPGVSTAEVDSEIQQNVFDNLWRFDDSLNIVPDIASAVPTQANGGISSDGLTYTVHLKSGVKFNNGDPMSSKDVLYSWNRAAALQGPYASNLSGIDGYDAVQRAAGSPPSNANGAGTVSFQQNIENRLAANDPKFQMKGLTAPDATSVQIKLAHPCGWCLTAWTLESTTGAIVNEKTVQTDPVNWWRKPVTPGQEGGMVGTGAFYLSSFTAKQSIAFKAVSNWWGSPKPTLTEVDIAIHDPSAIAGDVSAWEQGSFDLIGYGGNSSNLTYPLIQGIKNNARFSSQLLTQPKGRSTWVSFNVGYPTTGGPFLGESAAAKGLRMAFNLAVDKQGLVSTACHNVLCTAATGGLITKGLKGYLGDGNDPLAKYDPTQAKSLLQQYDPSGSLTSHLKYSYNAGGLNDSVAAYLQNEWQTNLGVKVQLDPSSDASQFINNRLAGKYVMSRDGWQFDYNHPQDWFDNLWGAVASAGGSNTSGFDDPTYDSVLKQADETPLDQALPMYKQLSQLLQQDVVYIPLYYSVANFAIHSYVKGAGSTTSFDHYWNEISIQSH
ncbi:MAG TPA: peptide ABC transporter substrate-binding protein [Candidatus Dormibacteraeota bacterium]|nr:peptide ABC transporter substrate-binding protein [Candidatus Dormibacteraeota bacterium]